MQNRAQLEVHELNGRPVAVRPIGGVGKCSLCDKVAVYTVYELWCGKRLSDVKNNTTCVWHWCGQCDEVLITEQINER